MILPPIDFCVVSLRIYFPFTFRISSHFLVISSSVHWSDQHLTPSFPLSKRESIHSPTLICPCISLSFSATLVFPSMERSNDSVDHEREREGGAETQRRNELGRIDSIWGRENKRVEATFWSNFGVLPS